MHYTPDVPRHPAFESLPAASRPIELPRAQAWAASELSLPMFPELTEPEIERVVEVCERFVEGCDQANRSGRRRALTDS